MYRRRFELPAEAPVALLAADMHLRDDSPECRTDDYQAEQRRKCLWFRDMVHAWNESDNVPVFHGGDLFNEHTVSMGLLAFAQEVLPWGGMVPGQHDLPWHSYSKLGRSAMGVLLSGASGFVNLADAKYEDANIIAVGLPFGRRDIEVPDNPGGKPVLLVMHETVTAVLGDEAFEAADARSVLARYPWADVVLVGDNHKQFVVRDGARALVNPGSFMRMTAAQVDHVPAVYAWYPGAPEPIVRIPVPITPGVVSREHIERQARHDERIDAYVECVRKDVDLSLSFDDNIETYMRDNPPPPRVRMAIHSILEEARRG